jgi:hypothetical protein
MSHIELAAGGWFRGVGLLFSLGVWPKPNSETMSCQLSSIHYGCLKTLFALSWISTEKESEMSEPRQSSDFGPPSEAAAAARDENASVQFQAPREGL